MTLNHPDWFSNGPARGETAEGRVDRAWLRAGTSDPEAADRVAKLEVVEHLRKAHGVRGALAEFRVDEAECLVTFRGPGYAADAFFDRDTGKYTLTQTYQGALAVFNDLHKARDTGPVWSAAVDVSAVLLSLVSVSGLLLIFYLKLRRAPGLAVALAGAAVVAAVAIWGV